MTKNKALRNFLAKYFNWTSNKMTMSDILMDVTENGSISGGGSSETKINYMTPMSGTVIETDVPGAYKLDIATETSEDLERAMQEGTITPDQVESLPIVITVDGTEYRLSNSDEMLDYVISDLTTYDFADGFGVMETQDASYFYFNTPGEHSVEMQIVVPDEEEETTSDDIVVLYLSKNASNELELTDKNFSVITSLSDDYIGKIVLLIDWTIVDTVAHGETAYCIAVPRDTGAGVRLKCGYNYINYPDEGGPYLVHRIVNMYNGLDVEDLRICTTIDGHDN